MDQLLYTIDETADALRTSRSTIYRLIKTGVLVSVKVGTSRRVSRQALDHYIDRLERHTRTHLAERFSR